MSLASNIDSLTFPLSGTRLIEASAGTGKTYTIAALYVRLILGHGWLGAELLPPDILVVTFTEAATQELRERIRARLTQAAGFFREKTGGDEFLRRLRDDYAAEQWPTCAYRLELAANWMDEAAVYTIHGWCNRMLQQHAFDSGSLFKQEVDTDDRELLNQVVRDYWRQFFYPLSATACRAVYRLANSPEQLAGVLRPLLFETEALGLQAPENEIAQAFQAWEDWAIQAEQLEQAARSLWRDDLPALQSLLNEASANGLLNGNLYRKAGFADKLRQLAAWATGEPLAAEALMKFGQQSLQAGLTKAHQDKAPLFETAPFRAIDDLAAHAANESDIADIITRHAIHWLRARYDAEKQRMARMTFDDMLQRLDLALRGGNGERLAAAIVKQYPLAMIDEFQDTDPVQYRIFARLYPAEADSGPGCFMIGDPKQAIYSFRGGDIFTYLKAHRATLGRHYTLSTNFRSTQAMVDAVNRIFMHAENQQAAGAFCFKRQDDNPLPFIPVAAQGREEVWLVDNQTAPALSFWQIADEQAIAMPAYRRQMAAATASEIVRLLHGAGAGRTGFTSPDGDMRPLQPADIAILVRSGHEARLMRQALAERQLRSVYLSERESIYASAEAADMLIWLQALAEPRNERKVRAAIGTATLGWSYHSLRQLALDELAWEQHLERFIGYRERWLQDGILPTLRQLMSDYALPARLQCLADGERRLTNLLHLAELLQQAGSRLEGEQALIRHLAETIAADQTGEESVIRLESDANLIKIVTIHKSKGLEYPLVFLPFICGFREASGRDRYYRYHDSEFALHIDLHKSDDGKAGADRERLQEDLRLLYVAITRARYACWLGMAAVKNGPGKTSQLHKSAIGYVLGWRAGMAASELNARLTDLRAACPAIDILEAPAAGADIYRPSDSATAVDGPRHSAAVIGDNWWIASYSALQTEDGSAPAIEADTFRDDKRIDELDSTPVLAAPAAEGVHALPRGAGPGVLVHELMEQCAQLGFSYLQARPELAAQMINSIFKQPDWDNKRETLGQALQQWLTLSLTGADGIGLSGLDSGSYQAEMEFLLGADNVDSLAVDSLVCRHTFGGRTRPRLQAKQINGLLKGFIDLVFVHEDRYYVLDYKFNALGNEAGAYSQDKLEQAMLNKRYDLQATLYLLALHRLLKSRLGTAYAYDRHIGGGVYLFLRGADSAGAGRLSFKPPAMLIEALDRLFCAAAITGIAA